MLLRSGFSADAYLKLYPDLAAAGVDPYVHYALHGRAEGRLGMFPAVSVDARLDSIRGDRPTVLVVCHDGTRTGAPVLGYNLVQRLLRNHQVVAMFLGDGPVIEACRALGAVVVGPVPSIVRTSGAYADHVLSRILAATPIRFAIVNSIESRYMLAALARRRIPTITLIHEFAVDTQPRDAFREAAFWSGEMVFSSTLTRDNAIAELPDLAGREYPIIEQGCCSLPRDDSRPRAAQQEDRIARGMRPAGFARDGFVVLGAGTVYFRKGVDLFVDCAARVLRRAGDEPFRFVWVGKVPDHERGYKQLVADQIRRAGLEKHVHFLDEVADLEAVYTRADVMLLSSRLDPLPNVAIDALARRIPVVCFDRTTGMADVLRRHGLADSCLAGYLDTDDAAQKIVALARSAELRREVAGKCAEAFADFDMDHYVDRLEQLAAKDLERSRQELRDIDTIASSSVLQLDYHRAPGCPELPADEVITRYVRGWATGVLRRKLFPGFHPGVYRELHGVAAAGADPLADYLRAKRPVGPWALELVTPARRGAPPKDLRVALHVHVHYPDLLSPMMRRLEMNTVRPDLLVSVSTAAARREVEGHLRAYRGDALVREVPNRGRDIGPMLTEFAEALRHYDVFGHLHTKKSTHARDIGRIWYEFLLDNLLGGAAPMADVILARMAEDATIGIAFPDDPHVNGWDENLLFIESLIPRLGIARPPREFAFPIGTMFWARPGALQPLFALGLDWGDYPEEPLPINGTMLHGLERLFALVATQRGYRTVLTHVPGRTR